MIKNILHFFVPIVLFVILLRSIIQIKNTYLFNKSIGGAGGGAGGAGGEYCKTLALNTIFENTNKDASILAGRSYYSDLWVRDAFITMLGLFAQNTATDIIKKNIHTISKNIRDDGLVPLRIGKKSYFTRMFFGFYSDNANVPIYKDDKAFSEPTDSNPQFIILCWLYYTFTKDTPFIQRIHDKINKSYDHMCRSTSGGLLRGTYFHSWYDTFAFNGADLFSNVLYLYSIKCFKQLVNLGVGVSFREFEFDYMKIRRVFMREFWNDRYLKISPKINVMETAGNSLAILMNILNKKEAMSVIRYIEDNNEYDIAPVVIPKMPRKYLWTPGYLVGMQGYHNDRLWMWPHHLYLASRHKMKLDYSADNVEQTTRKYGVFFENLNERLGPYRHWFQNTEMHFSESCGSYLFLVGNVHIF